MTDIRSVGQTFGQRENSIPSHKHSLRGYNYDGLESPMLHTPSFVEIGLPVPEKKIFKGFLPYMDVAAILVM